MNNFVKVWEKSLSENLDDVEIINAAKDLLNILRFDLLSKGVELSADPKVICILKNPIPIPSHDSNFESSFSQKFAEAFKVETGKEWNDNDYLVVKVLTQTLGGSTFVVFDRNLKQ